MQKNSKKNKSVFRLSGGPEQLAPENIWSAGGGGGGVPSFAEIAAHHIDMGSDEVGLSERVLKGRESYQGESVIQERG